MKKNPDLDVLETYLEKVRCEAKNALRRANFMEQLIVRLTDPSQPGLWRSTDRLTDAGLSLVNDALEAGLTQADLSRWFGFGIGSANYHWKAWHSARRRELMNAEIARIAAGYDPGPASEAPPE
jgi:hypothetical protein